MRPRARRALLLVIALAALAALAGPSALAVEEVYDPRTLELARQMGCPVCEGQTVADSQSRVALEMRQAIEAQVRAGRSDAEIFDFFVARYGQEVLVKPPREGINLALWWTPVIALLIGIGVVGLYLRDSARLGRLRPASASERHEVELEQIAEQISRESQTPANRRPGDTPAELL